MDAEAPGQLRRRVAGLGAGGHARVVLETLAEDASIEVVELLDPGRRGETVAGVEVTGGDERLGALADELDAVFVGIGGTGETGPRRRLFELARQHGLEVLTVIHRTAVVASSARLGRGAQVLAGAVVGTASSIGDNVLLNTGAIVDHDCVVGAHAHIATGARLSGGVTVGEGAHVGTGASVRQGITIGAGAVVGVGAAVVRDVPAGVVVAGVPASPLVRAEARR